MAEKFWERFFRTEGSITKRLLIALLVAVLGFLLIAFLYNKTGVYYSTVTIFATVLITLYSGLWSGVFLTILLVLAADYFYVPPIGSVLNNEESVEHFLIVVGLGIIMSFFSASLRVSYRRTILTNQELEKAIQARDEMVGIISHELKNPLTALQTGTLLIQKLLSRDPKLENVLNLVERLMPSVHRMNRLISDLLDVTRLEAKALKLEPRVCDLLDVAQEVVKSQEASAYDKLVELKSDIQAECRYAYCDPDRTAQVLTNLVNNAIKFTNSGGSVSISAKKIVARKIEVQVSDTGKGIAKEYLPHVFDRFWQARETAYKGTGLGLSIAKGLIEAQGGTIKVESQMGIGTTFYLTLPLAEKAIEALREQAAS